MVLYMEADNVFHVLAKTGVIMEMSCKENVMVLWWSSSNI